MSALDQLLVENNPGGMDHLGAWFRSVLVRLVAASRELGDTQLSGDFLYEAYKRHPPNEETLAAVIGLVFRVSAAHMIFTADMMKGGGISCRSIPGSPAPRRSPASPSSRTAPDSWTISTSISSRIGSSASRP